MDDEEQQSNGFKVAIGSGAAIFIIGAVFWAGATYNRVEGIESQLSVIQQQISRLGNFQALEERGTENQRRIEKLEDQMMRLPH